MNILGLVIVHAAIVLMWVLPGALALLYVTSRYPRALGASPDVAFIITAAFLTSLALVTVLGVAASTVTGRYDVTAILVFLLCIGLIVLVIRRRRRGESLWPLVEHGIPEMLLLLLTAVMFVIMMMNGGLIDMLADGWWHMSLANKIADAKTVYLEKQHLLGFEVGKARPVYPSLWHMNLAVLSAVTGQPLPMLWHVWGAYGVVFTLLSYFVFVKALVRNGYAAVISTALLCLLLGGINSYFRVAPWPGNVSYIVWYFLMALVFMMVDRYGGALKNRDVHAARWFGGSGFLQSLISANLGLLVLAALCALLVYGLHPGALFWCLTGFVFYGVILAMWRGDDSSMDVDRNIFLPPVGLLLCGILLWQLFAFIDDGDWTALEWGAVVPFLPVLMILIAVGILMMLDRTRAGRKAYWLTWFGLFVSLLFFVDGSHVADLLQASSEKAGPYRHHIPTQVDTVWGQTLYLPNWEHQLRSGLLFSALLAVPLSLWLLIESKSRASVFLTGNVLFSMLTLTSPYVFTWFSKLIPLASIYRVQLLIFHPVVIGFAVFLLIEKLKSAVIRGESA